MLFFFILTMMTMIGAVPVLIVYIGNKSRNENTRLGSSEKILQLEQRIEELENEVKHNMERRIENIETIVTETEYYEGSQNRLENNENHKQLTDSSHFNNNKEKDNN